MLEQLRHLAAGTTGGAFLFRPQGRLKEWEMVGYGLYGRTVTSLVADQRGGVFLAIERGMLRYTEDWSDWKPLYQGLPYPDVYSIALDHRTERLYAGTAPAAVFNSVNRGKEWFPSGETSALSFRNGWTNPEPPHRPRLIRLIAHPTLENTLIGGVQAGGPYFEAQAVCVHGVDPDRLLLAVNHPLEPSSILFSSKDGGRNWQVACSELPVSEAGRVTCLESGGGAFFAGTENGIILGSRDGSQWELVRAELPPIRTLLWVGEVPGKTRLPLL